LKTNEDIVDKLKYLGLDLNNIPERYKEYKTLDFRPSKYGDERNYKIYRYLNINDIEILITPTNRMCDITEKYGKAVPLYAYLDENSEENIERHTTFLNMLNKLNINEVEDIEKEQKELNKKVPFTVKYPKNYLWQIYYSEYTNKYFMLVTTEDLDYSAFFYVLKMQLSKKNSKLFVPISYLDYSRQFFNRTEIEEIEKYLCFFTKEWPLIYEVYDKEENCTLQITGETIVYDSIKSRYKIKFSKKNEAEKFYKLLKALFILQTQLSNYYKFDLKIDYKGALNFYFGDKKIIYEILSSVIKEEYIKAEDLSKNIIKEKNNYEKEIKKLKQKSQELELEFIEKEKLISTFLECRKSFFGRVKYFFTNKKTFKSKNAKKEEIKSTKEDIDFIEYTEIKDHYTLEELVNLYKQIIQCETSNKELKLDIKAQKNRIKNIESKIKNATQYIEEIEEHKKSIFEFWKFTNKDKISELNQGQTKEETKGNLKKVFNYELDFESLSKMLDKRQREILSQEELNSIFAISTFLLKDINTVLNKKSISKERLEQVKVIAAKEKMLFSEENFDIFGAIDTSTNKLKTLANRKHRETERELFKILDINQSTTIKQYTDIINKVIKDYNFAIKRMNTNIELSVYAAQDEMDVLNIFYINPEKAINDFRNNEENEINLYKIKINENTPILALTNIIYYNNTNRTLPLGMNITDGILIDTSLIELEEVGKEKFNIITYEEPQNEMSKIIVKKLNVFEYQVKV